MAYTTINKSSDHFNTVAWTGTSSSPVNVTGYGFQPDMIWNKYRAGAGDHQLYDAVRTATKMIIPNSDAAESTNANGVTAFISDGFTAGSDINVNGGNSVAWGWKAGNSSGSSNTDGSITSTVSANTTAGFSIVKYTGTGSNATIGHGLGAVPKMIMVKNLGNANAWSVYHASLGATKYLALNEADAAGTASDRWQDTTPTSSVFSIGTNANQGGSYNYIAYCFAEKKGFSKFGEYEGNENADGSFVYTGFKPAFVMIKNRGAASTNWFIHDNKRLGYNEKNYGLFPDLNNAEATDINLDLLSNGFKLRRSVNHLNHNGNYYVYMAFSEAPLVGSNNVPCTAR